ncbi:unnamed protein product [Caenorhabditis sp. 36 PRJEB53466]|nr:unnamed protein product [Caenorhabditis sp. 36 PRJEB53466]
MPRLPRIDYYFDVISPYSYVGFEALNQLQHQWKGVSVRYIPFYLASVMKEAGNRPPALVPARGAMMMTDLGRTANYWGIPLTSPPLFMDWIRKYRTIDAMLILLVLEDRDPGLMARAAREMWLRLWSRSEKIFEEHDFMEILRAVEVSDAAAVIAESKTEKYRQRLTENTEKCKELSAYGAPWINVLTSDGAEHSFFGSDRFHLIAELLDQPQPLPHRLFNKKSNL